MPRDLIHNQKVYACTEANCGSGAKSTAISDREIFTRQTGQILLTIGEMFITMPAFNSHIDQGTGELLISLGNKLAARK